MGSPLPLPPFMRRVTGRILDVLFCGVNSCYMAGSGGRFVGRNHDSYESVVWRREAEGDSSICMEMTFPVWTAKLFLMLTVLCFYIQPKSHYYYFHTILLFNSWRE